MWCVKYEKWSGEKGAQFFEKEKDARTFYRKMWAKEIVVAQSIAELGHEFEVLAVRPGPAALTSARIRLLSEQKILTVLCRKRDLLWYKWFRRSAWNQCGVRLGDLENAAWRWLVKRATER
jgi:hypothetical protein